MLQTALLSWRDAWHTLSVTQASQSGPFQPAWHVPQLALEPCWHTAMPACGARSGDGWGWNFDIRADWTALAPAGGLPAAGLAAVLGEGPLLRSSAGDDGALFRSRAGDDGALFRFRAGDVGALFKFKADVEPAAGEVDVDAGGGEVPGQTSPATGWLPSRTAPTAR